MNKTNNLFKILAVGTGALLVAIIVYRVFKKDNNTEKIIPKNESTDKQPEQVDNYENIIIGDSQTPFISRQSKNIKMLGAKGGESVLWKGGMGLNWLKDAVSKYPKTDKVKNVVINIGTNGGFNVNEDIAGLISQLNITFPKAKFYAVKGSWGWGGNKSVTTQKVNSYYDKFAKQGVIILNPAIGYVIDPHANLPIYKEIGKSIDEKIK